MALCFSTYCAARSTYISLCAVAFEHKPCGVLVKIHCWVLGKSPEAVGSHITVFVYVYHVHILPYYVSKSYYPKRRHNAVLLHIFCFHLKLKNIGGRATGKSSLGYFQPRKQAAAGSFAKQAVPVKFLPTAHSVGSLSFE